MRWFKNIVIDENNYQNVIERLQKVCHNYFMTEKRITKNHNGEVVFKNSFFNIYYNHKKRRSIKLYNTFIRVSEHPLINNLIFKTRPVIHLDIRVNEGMSIDIGDSIIFLPFGGFIVNTDSDWMGKSRSVVYFTHIYIPILWKKIGDMSKLMEERDNINNEINKEYDSLV